MYFFLLLIIVFGIGVITGTLLYRRYYIEKMLYANPNYNPDNLPDSTSVRIDSTNLPIIFINTLGKHVERNGYITATMTIINNGKGKMNYGDTIKCTNQVVDYKGYIAIKYRGKSSYAFAPKKPYVIKTLKNSLEKGGKKKKTQLLGLRRGKKWALKAGCLEKSMIRDALTAELAKPYKVFVPEVRFCEVVVNGIYRGVYYLSEQITADRLNIHKPGDIGNSLTGGYLMQIDERNHGVKGNYSSKRYEHMKYLYEYPDSEKLTFNQKKYICGVIDEMEKKVKEKDVYFAKIVDVQSMIDYQLVVEFSCNVDGYKMSTFMYKFPDDIDPRIKFGVWDFDMAYGNYAGEDGGKWLYQNYESWWKDAMEIPQYTEQVRRRWEQYRISSYSNEHIEHVIDSLATLLTYGGAESRNADAWNIWKGKDWTGPRRFLYEKYMAVSYEEEIGYLKECIYKRLQWMDQELLTR